MYTVFFNLFYFCSLQALALFSWHVLQHKTRRNTRPSGGVNLLFLIVLFIGNSVTLFLKHAEIFRFFYLSLVSCQRFVVSFFCGLLIWSAVIRSRLYSVMRALQHARDRIRIRYLSSAPRLMAWKMYKFGCVCVSVLLPSSKT